jgi:hypothetical protein
MNAGHNSELTPAEWKALKMHHFRAIQAQKDKVEEQQAEYKRLRKLAKADQIILSDIDFMMKCADVEDETIVTERIKREAEIASWFALPIEFQPDMFGDHAREPGEDLAGRRGKAAGASGVGSNPYDENSKEGRAWAEAWSNEQAIARDALQSAMEKVNAASTDGDELIQGADAGDPFADDHLEAAE